MCIYTPMFKLYTILFSRDSKTKKVRHPHQHPHPHPHPHPHQNKTKVFGVESEILIKYKRIKWTPRVKASLLFFQGENSCRYKIILEIMLIVMLRNVTVVIFYLFEVSFVEQRIK